MMDSIFQIKINENKLQRILNELSKNQNCFIEELAHSKNMFIQNIDSQTSAKKQFYDRIEEIDKKIVSNIKQISENVKINFKQCHESIALNAQTTATRISKLQEMIIGNSENILQHRTELQEKLCRMGQEMEQKEGTVSQDVKQKLQKIQRLQKLEKQMQKVSQLTELMQNKNFLYFLHMLIDKEQQHFLKLPESIRQIKNPLHHEPSEQKAKRYKQLKRILEDTQGKLETMQSQYTGYFQTASQGNKQAQENTHLHYAFLASRIKDLETKMESLNVQRNYYLDKVVYPSDSREKKDKLTSRLKIQGDERNSSRNIIGVKSKQQIVAIVKEQVDPVRNCLDNLKKQLKTKMQKIEDKFWSANNKIEQIRNSIGSMKLEVDKLKISGAHQGVDKDGIIAKAGGLLNHFRNIQDEIEQKLLKKVDLSDYTHNNQHVGSKLKIFAEQVDEKANKQETRKAFNFMEEKIREIVTLLADMQNSSRKTAARKMMMQCLSCDDNFFEQKQNTSRPITSRMLHKRTSSGLKLKIGQSQAQADRTIRKSNL